MDFWILKSEWTPLAKFVPKKKKTKTKPGDAFTGAHQSSANGQPPSKLRMTIPQTVRKVVPYAATSTSSQERPYPETPIKTKMQNIKKVYFCTKLFKNTSERARAADECVSRAGDEY